MLLLAAQQGRIPFKVFSIIDRDGAEVNESGTSRLIWDVYHIENYLLNEAAILQAARDVAMVNFQSEAEVYDALRECAAETMGELIRHELSLDINAAMRKTIELKTGPNPADLSQAFSEALDRTASRFEALRAGSHSDASLRDKEAELRTRYQVDLATGTWKSTFRGRDILKRFVGKHLLGKVAYEAFRNIIIARMRDAGIQPVGMKTVVESVLAG